jgi:hypothetical protein
LHSIVYLERDYGGLRKETVYLRRGSATDIATPHEISKMGIHLVHERPQLRLVTKLIKPRRGSIILGIENLGDASAKAPYFSFVIPEWYSLARYGLDGNGSEGFLGPPHGGSNHRRPQYGGKADSVIHSRTRVEVAAIEFGGREEERPSGDILIEYELAAEDTPTLYSSVAIKPDGSIG